MKIVADENIPFLEEAFSSLGEVTPLPGRSITKGDLTDAEILLVRSVTPVNKSLLENTPVKFVASATIGFDHLDKEYLEKKNIPWSTAPGCNATAAAEYVIAALLHLASIRSISLKNKTAAIIGCGNVGSRVKSRLESLGVHTVINDPPLQQRESKQDYIELKQALSADIITLHVPLSRTGKYPTYHLLNNRNISTISSDSILLNTSRGAVIDNKSLLRQLLAKRFTTVLDVWEGEPDIMPALMDKCILATPHIAGYSLDGRVKGTEMIYRDCCQYLNVTPTWQTDSILGSVENKIIDLTDANGIDSAIQHAVHQVYDITADDRKLRNTATLPENQRGSAFDQLRKNYPLRREFASYTTKIPYQESGLENTLRTLGFNVQTEAHHQ